MRLKDATVSIVGMGLMGGSMGLALEGFCKARVGVVRSAEAAKEAERLGAVDCAVTELASGVAEADLVVLATPVRTILSLIPELGSLMRPGAVLIDLGSTKAEIVAAMERLPDGIAAIGGHPMCGKETSGLQEANADLYRGAIFALVPCSRSTPEAASLARELAQAVGARSLALDAERHDRAVAFVSHLPYLLAAALTHVEAGAAKDDSVLDKLASSGFRDTSRLAASDKNMMLDILLTNRQAVEEALAAFEAEISVVRKLLDAPEDLKEWIERAQGKRRTMFQ